MVNSKRIGSSETMVASIVVVPPAPPVTRLPRRHAAVADAAGDRRAQLGEFEIELGLPHRGLVGRDRSRRCAEGLGALVEGLLGDGAVAHELLGAFEIGLGEGEIGLGLRQSAARLRDACSGTAACRW